MLILLMFGDRLALSGRMGHGTPTCGWKKWVSKGMETPALFVGIGMLHTGVFTGYSVRHWEVYDKQ